MAHLAITPARAGPVSASIVLMANDLKPLQAKEVALVLANPDAGIEPIRRAATDIGDGAWRVDGLIVVGSRNLTHFDAALVGYTFATLFAAFGNTGQICMHIERMYLPASRYEELSGGPLSERLMGTLREALGFDPTALLDNCVKAVSTFRLNAERNDDLTMLALKYKGIA